MCLSIAEHVAASHVTVIAGKPNLLEIHIKAVLAEMEERWLEFKPSLMNGDSMSDVLCRRRSNVRVRFSIERDLELTDAVHTVEQAEKVDSNIWQAEGRLELLHILTEFPILRGLRDVTTRTLEVAERLPCEAHHFFVAFG